MVLIGLHEKPDTNPGLHTLSLERRFRTLHEHT